MSRQTVFKAVFRLRPLTSSQLTNQNQPFNDAM